MIEHNDSGDECGCHECAGVPLDDWQRMLATLRSTPPSHPIDPQPRGRAERWLADGGAFERDGRYWYTSLPHVEIVPTDPIPESIEARRAVTVGFAFALDEDRIAGCDEAKRADAVRAYIERLRENYGDAVAEVERAYLVRRGHAECHPKPGPR
jgi:hypothetical protein